MRIVLLTAMFAAGGLAFSAFRTPVRMFVRFVAMDSGAELAIPDMLGRGFQPGIDFGYPYGLLPLLIGRVWYGLAGNSPASFNGLVASYLVLSCWGLARFVTYRGVGTAGVVLIGLAIVDLSYVTVLTSAHVLEQALLINALAEQARGRRGTALALLAACCFVKPALAFVQGFAVLVAVVVGNRADRAATARFLVPPLITAAVLAAILTAAFGPLSLARTLSPATGAAIYRLERFGFFFGKGRDFWDLPAASFLDYFRYELGSWMLGTAALAWGGVTEIFRLARGSEANDRAVDDELVATCAMVHLVFVTMLFGHRVTWIYSLPMLMLGLATLSNRGTRYRVLTWGLAALLLVNARSKVVAVHLDRQSLAPSRSTLGLWSSPSERADWERALELTRGKRVAMLAMSEGGTVLFPGMAPPVAGYLVPGCPTPIELERKADQLAGASMIISFQSPEWGGFDLWPRLKAAFDGCELVYEGPSLQVYRRNPPARIEPEVPAFRAL